MDTDKINLDGKTGTLHLLDDYDVELNPEDFIIIVASADFGSAGENFRHPNIAARCSALWELKHYHPKRGKFWTEKIGTDFYFFIPKKNINLLVEKGYSYPKIEIGGVVYRLNVSGGTGNGKWTDYIPVRASTGLGHPKKSLKNLADNAYTLEEIKGKNLSIAFPEFSLYQKDVYKDIAAKKATALQVGQKIWLGKTFLYDGKKGPFEITFIRSKGKQKGFICGDYLRIKKNQIDWIKTSEENGIKIPEPHFENKTI